MWLKCGATAWTARPKLLSTHSRVASRAVYSTRFAALAIRGPRILRPMRLMFSKPMSLLVSHNLILSGRVKNVYRHLHFLTLMFSNKVETDQYIFHLLFLRHICADCLCHSLHRYACRYTGTMPLFKPMLTHSNLNEFQWSSHKNINLILYSRKAVENIMCKSTAILSQHKFVKL